MVCTGRARLKAGGVRARAERTRNMWPMVVTLDVSKLSGWLNLRASCRVEKRSCVAGPGADWEARGCGAAVAQASCTGKARLKAGGQGAGREHAWSAL